MTDVIRIENLYKSYGDVKAVQNLSFKIKRGELFAFLGVNGAGKSTTISMMCKTIQKDSGKIFVDGKDIDVEDDSVKRSIGVVFQSSVLDKSLSVKDNLVHRASLYGIMGKECQDKIQNLCDMFNMSDILNRTVGKLSGGQRRKVDIARALIHNPSILILDEPTTGLDPQTRTNLWNVIETLRKKENLTVLLTTHYMEEAADADYVVIIDKGQIVAEGTPHDLKDKYSADYITLYNADEEQVKAMNVDYEKKGDTIKIAVENTKKATELIVKYPQVFADFEIVKGKMDSVFLTVTGKNLSEGE